jgi:cyclo(L-tyrosyl-L-tyrosyl) synthase
MHSTTDNPYPPGFSVTPYTENCKDVCNRREHVLIGVSPGNSYFSEERLTELLGWANTAFSRVDTIIPDTALAHTYRALGESSQRAWTKAQSKTRRLQRRIARAWATLGLSEGQQRSFTLSEVNNHPRYQALLSRTQQAVAEQPDVRTVFLAASEQALRTHLAGTLPTTQQVCEAAQYLIAEIPMCADTPGILGVPSSVNIYHQMIPVIPALFEGEWLPVSPHQAFAIVRPAPALEPIPSQERAKLGVDTEIPRIEPAATSEARAEKL